MDLEKKLEISTLLTDNSIIFEQLINGVTIDKQSARDEFYKNVQRIRNELGLTDHLKQIAVENYLRRKKEIDDSQEQVSDFFNVAKTELDDALFPKVNKVYHTNGNTFNIEIEEELDPQASVSEPLTDETYSREEWQGHIQTGHIQTGCIGGDKLIFDEDIIAVAKAFMVGPVGIQRQKCIAAETKTFDSFEQLKEYVLTEANEKDMILYMTFSYSVKDIYCWRGVFLDKQ